MLQSEDARIFHFNDIQVTLDRVDDPLCLGMWISTQVGRYGIFYFVFPEGIEQRVGEIP